MLNICLINNYLIGLSLFCTRCMLRCLAVHHTQRKRTQDIKLKKKKKNKQLSKRSKTAERAHCHGR